MNELIRCLRGMIAALGRRRSATERDLFIKLDAWHILQMAAVPARLSGHPVDFCLSRSA